MRKYHRRPEKIENGERLLLCTRCERFFGLDAFYLDMRSPSGRTNYCHPCRAAVNKEYSLRRAAKRELDKSVEKATQMRRPGEAPPIPSLAKLLGAA